MDGCVLVVEDSADLRLFAVIVLQSLGLRVLEAGTGEEALALARRERPDLVLLDAVLPGIDGLEVAASLADDPATAGARVVIASSLVRRDDRGASARRGVHGYLHKPYRRAELVACVESMLDQPRE